MRIIISPYSRQLRNGGGNPKNYPYWSELVKLLKDNNIHIIQIGRAGETQIDGVDEMRCDLSLKDLKKLLDSCDTWIGVDNFFQHFCHLYNRPGIAIFGQSDPLIFGHSENTNLLKDRKYLREKQFDLWEYAQVITEAFVPPSEVIESLIGRTSKWTQSMSR